MTLSIRYGSGASKKVTGAGFAINWYGDLILEAMRKELEERLRECGKAIRNHIGRSSMTLASVAGHSKVGEYPHRVTDAFVKGLYYQIRRDFATASMSVTVSSFAPHAKFLEEGTSGGTVIFPVRAKALSWTNLQTGATVFARYVHHKGFAARQPFAMGLKDTEVECKNILTAPM